MRKRKDKEQWEEFAGTGDIQKGSKGCVVIFVLRVPSSGIVDMITTICQLICLRYPVVTLHYALSSASALPEARFQMTVKG